MLLLLIFSSESTLLPRGISLLCCYLNTMKRALSVISVGILFVLASCSAEYIEPLQEHLALRSEQGQTLKTGDIIRLEGKEALIIIYRGGEKVDVSLTDVSPDDIKSINVLKGASAISAYGEKGKNGVLILRLKK